MSTDQQSALPKPPNLINPIVPANPSSHPLGPRSQPQPNRNDNRSHLSPSAEANPSPVSPQHNSPLSPSSQPPNRPLIFSHQDHQSQPSSPLPPNLPSSSSSQSSGSSSNSNQQQQQQHQQHSQTRPRIRTDSFFGIDTIEPFQQSPQPVSASQQPYINSTPHSDQRIQQRQPDPNQFTQAQPVNPNLRPSSFYGLQVDPTAERTQGQSSPHYRSSGTNSPASSLPPDSTDHRHRQLNTLSIGRTSQRRQSSRLSSIPHPQEGFILDPNNPNSLSAGPLLDNSHLKPGNKAKLLNHAKTLELYRNNAKKTNDPEVMFEFGCFLMDLVKEMNYEDDEDYKSADGQTDSLDGQRRRSTLDPSPKSSSPGCPSTDREKEKASLTQEALFLLQKLSNRGHVQSQFLLADCYTKAIGTGGGVSSVGLQQLGSGGPGSDISSPMTRKGSKQDYERAFPLFVLAAKHGHVEAMYRAGQCCEFGWGTRKERDKALQFYRKAAIAQHPLAMYRLGLADLNGDLGQPRKPKDGVKWLKRAAEMADSAHPNPLHELALLHERGLEHVVFVDYDYAVELLARAAELGYAPSAYKLGECYEYGRMGCPQDAALSIHYYNIAAQQNHKEACFALTAWYLVGSPGVLPQSDTEAYLWAKKAAEAGLAKAEYAVGYFTEVGVGTTRDEREAQRWFRSAAEHGDKRAKERLKNAAGGLTVIQDGTIKDNNKDARDGAGGKRKSRSPLTTRRNTGSPNENSLPVHPPLPPPHPSSGQGLSPIGAENKKGKEDCIIV
ncbi:hypothetical protein PGT21_036588 [Puccinia graminis f. sp. tritici]|uniref:Uncharacterized protein n=1 Tax=Puccinia graminis f. sp. tritici TaxID=56615 RepID=A0A5B0RLN7_PUCGR|nr:hypothetical protein PGT21_036588 [Puccinia graminis f. sp. tritici]KAA1126192.1 hypothetical protein PGTUg99_010025 [Puccinia graminis f. sp. tritici]